MQQGDSEPTCCVGSGVGQNNVVGSCPSGHSSDCCFGYCHGTTCCSYSGQMTSNCPAKTPPGPPGNGNPPCTTGSNCTTGYCAPTGNCCAGPGQACGLTCCPGETCIPANVTVYGGTSGTCCISAQGQTTPCGAGAPCCSGNCHAGTCACVAHNTGTCLTNADCCNTADTCNAAGSCVTAACLGPGHGPCDNSAQCCTGSNCELNGCIGPSTETPSVCWNGTGQECPPGWTCPELSIFGVNFPTFCCLPTGSQSQQAASCCSQRLVNGTCLCNFNTGLGSHCGTNNDCCDATTCVAEECLGL